MTLKLVGLSKYLGGREVVRGATMAVEPGEIAVILGENGAGKSTLLRLVSGLMEPDAGEVWLGAARLDREPVRFKAQMGYVPDTTDAFPELRAGEYLALVSALKRPMVAHADPPEQWIDRLGVRGFWHQPIATLSFGQRKRLCTLAAQCGDPWLLVFDEPSNGLDPEGVDTIVELIQARAKDKKGTLCSTNDEAFAARVGGARYLLRDGQITRLAAE